MTTVTMVLIGWAALWVGFAVVARKAWRQSKVIAVGGGFIFSLLAIIGGMYGYEVAFPEKGPASIAEAESSGLPPTGPVNDRQATLLAQATYNELVAMSNALEQWGKVGDMRGLGTHIDASAALLREWNDRTLPVNDTRMLCLRAALAYSEILSAVVNGKAASPDDFHRRLRDCRAAAWRA